MEKVLVAMSGGVDSAVAALRLCEAGYDVQGVTLCLLQGKTQEAQKAAEICESIGIEHTVLHLEKEFERDVQRPFIEAYRNGFTPNPCVICNKKIKFGALMDYAVQKGFDKLATGHYASITKQNDRYVIKKAADNTKDQTYMLWQLSQDVLSRVLFPLDNYKKTENRQKAGQYKLKNADSPDSQDICFIENGDYAAFIENMTEKKSVQGNFVDTNGNVLGQHNGIIRYTIGQRKGLGIALGRPRFVISKDAASNTVVLGDERDLFYTKIYLKDTNYILIEDLKEELEVTAKLRYSQFESKALLRPAQDGAVLEFEQPQRAPAPGQTAVFYINDMLVGGGIIVKGE